MNKLISIDDVKTFLKDGMGLMVGGFMGVGTPSSLVSAVMDANIKNIKLIATDTATPEKAVGPLIVNKRIKKLIASHIGTNPETRDK
ncbi:Acetyl-CoA:acetoacetyl-CoA transferase, alpha subunit [Caldibacillus thermoamylovorans]|uniref:Acetyl-CoA:acetoacetyl-CoA transferase, alpha subunit n=1 Tax=Caldibacillus thermoamylovorans TaxID=35841 RepID=A0ABD4ABL7_9BACI